MCFACPGSQKRPSDRLGLELQLCVSDGNATQVPRKNSQYSYKLTHLSSPKRNTLKDGVLQDTVTLSPCLLATQHPGYYSRIQ